MHKNLKPFWEGFWEMAEKHTWKLIALIFTLVIAFMCIFGTFTTKWFQKDPMPIPKSLGGSK